ncbi:PD-(D/E)XK nuclease family protein [Roseibacillus persicicus]|uniref:PD-(D/E)XK nuclease family protein n=1 Tax=Roseibacillus persicicus TaxID=454148 RepID=UPI00280DF438|nr:PD-(D/E)XK nuclease family protein [Roseibacillus persicicus]MDQ8192519.1 PD-(D/E)XK nuclease family protein [Roseibacillus persicicus]
MKPNLFSLATKELSQDAFLAWLLQWAAPSSNVYNEKLHLVAAEFVNHLIALQGTVPAEIATVKAGRQWENIDVWAEINDSHLIIIEDKTATGEHSGQLARYKAVGEKWCKENGCELICVYIKTHSDSSQNLEQVREQGFAVMSRLDLLRFLNAHEVVSDIYNDFREQLRTLEARENGYRDKKIGDWSEHDWKGFYQELEGTRGLVNWGYVANPSGGFWNAVLNWFQCEGADPYMQIEQGPLCFKVGEVSENRREIRESFHRLLMDGAESDMGLQRPSRFGSGTYMTVAVIPRSSWLGADDEILNFDAVVGRLNRLELWLENVVTNHNQTLATA